MAASRLTTRQDVKITLPMSRQHVSSISVNVRQGVLVLTHDKIKLCLHDHLHAMEQRRLWLIPLGLVVTLTTTLLTSSFRVTGFVSAEMWQALFVISDILSVGWLGYELMFRRKEAKTVDELIAELGAGGEIVFDQAGVAIEAVPPAA